MPRRARRRHRRREVKAGSASLLDLGDSTPKGAISVKGSRRANELVFLSSPIACRYGDADCARCADFVASMFDAWPRC